MRTSDCLLDESASFGMLGGLGLLSLEEGLGLLGKRVRDWGSTPSAGVSKELGVVPTDVGNCFCRKARKSSSGKAEKVSGC